MLLLLRIKCRATRPGTTECANAPEHVTRANLARAPGHPGKSLGNRATGHPPTSQPVSLFNVTILFEVPWQKTKVTPNKHSKLKAAQNRNQTRSHMCGKRTQARDQWRWMLQCWEKTIVILKISQVEWEAKHIWCRPSNRQPLVGHIRGWKSLLSCYPCGATQPCLPQAISGWMHCKDINACLWQDLGGEATINGLVSLVQICVCVYLCVCVSVCRAFDHSDQISDHNQSHLPLCCHPPA